MYDDSQNLVVRRYGCRRVGGENIQLFATQISWYDVGDAGDGDDDDDDDMD